MALIKAHQSGYRYVSSDVITSLRVDGAGTQWAVYADCANSGFNGTGSVQVSTFRSSQAAAEAVADSLAATLGTIDLS